MKLTKTSFKDLVIIKHNIFEDNRGCFKEKYKIKELEKYVDYEINFCQQNSVKSYKNVLRGLHFQKEPYAQSKLISIEIGEILDIAVDLRSDSKTYGKYFSYILTADNNESLFIPRGFAHGYLTLSEIAILNYNVDNYYNPRMECGISYNDKFLNIDWGINDNRLIISEKDRNQNFYEW